MKLGKLNKRFILLKHIVVMISTLSHQTVKSLEQPYSHSEANYSQITHSSTLTTSKINCNSVKPLIMRTELML